MAARRTRRGPPLRHRRERLPLGAGGRLTIGVVADTHSRPHPETLPRLRAERPDVLLHAGDIGDLAVLDALEDVAPLHAVRGNIDDPGSHLPDALTIELTDGDEPVVTLLLTHIAVRGGRLRPNIRELAGHEEAQLVVCGHSHVPLLVRDGPFGVFNPGSCGPRRFHLPILVGVIDVGPERVAFRHIDLETGADWRPDGAPVTR